MKDGLQPWQPLAVYSMVPFAPVTDGRMFDYATGKWAPARFNNYVTGEWTTGVPSTDVTIPVGSWTRCWAAAIMQIAREGWGEQKSQNGGANPALSGPADGELSPVGRGAEAAGRARRRTRATKILFHNGKVEHRHQHRGADPAGEGQSARVALRLGLRQIDTSISSKFETARCTGKATG